jgi:hypothetical protein
MHFLLLVPEGGNRKSIHYLQSQVQKADDKWRTHSLFEVVVKMVDRCRTHALTAIHSGRWKVDVERMHFSQAVVPRMEIDG